MSLSLLTWRRRVHALYAEVRGSRRPAAARTQLWRRGRDDLLAQPPGQPAAARGPGRLRRPARSGRTTRRYRFEVAVDPDVEPHRLEVPTATDGVVPFERIGVLHLPDLGDLDVWWLDSYGGGVFVPVKDALAGRETYGARSLPARHRQGRRPRRRRRPRHRRGTLVVDLNFAYNPSCAYDPAWVCPLAPPGNVLPVPVPVGELYPLHPAP